MKWPLACTRLLQTMAPSLYTFTSDNGPQPVLVYFSQWPLVCTRLLQPMAPSLYSFTSANGPQPVLVYFSQWPLACTRLLQPINATFIYIVYPYRLTYFNATSRYEIFLLLVSFIYIVYPYRLAAIELSNLFPNKNVGIANIPK